MDVTCKFEYREPYGEVYAAYCVIDGTEYEFVQVRTTTDYETFQEHAKEAFKEL